MRNRVRLSTEQATYLQEHYKDTLNKDLAKAIGLNHPKMVTFALNQLGIKRTKEEVKSLMAKADNPARVKFVFTDEQAQFLRDNIETLNNREIAEKLGFKQSFIKDKLIELGIRRSDEARLAIVVRARNSVDFEKVAKKRLKIEGGGRDASMKTKWHLIKWQQKNGALSKRQVLVYKTANYDNYDDVVLIQRSKFDSFIRSRDNKLAKPARDAEKAKQRALADAVRNEKRAQAQLKKDEKEKIQAEKDKVRHKKTIINAAMAEKRKIVRDQAEKMEEFKRNYKPKTIAQAQDELLGQGKVPVKLDHKTTIWVKREKCIRQEDGSWIKKPNETTIHGKTKDERANARTAKAAARDRAEAGEPEIEDIGGTAEQREEVGDAAGNSFTARDAFGF